MPAIAQAPHEEKALAEVTAHEVLLDLVVKDKKEKLVRDLKQDEVEVFEDDVPQHIKSFALREESSPAAVPSGSSGTLLAAGGSARPVLDPLRQINLVSILVERLSPGGRAMARQAMRSFLAEPLARNTYVAVFVLDNRLNAIQAFTNDRDLIEKAIERATAGLYSQYSADSEKILTQLEELRLKAFVGGSGATGANVDQALDGLMIQMLMEEFRTSRYQHGRREIDALTMFANEQRALPGRKTVLYFSQGLVVPLELRDSFQNLISVANQNNVSFYAFDLRGLRVAATVDPQALEVQAQLMSQGESMPVSVRQELNETQMNLAKLAESTGGFLSANTNSMTVPMRRAVDEMSTHYELSYVPSSGYYDGHFRKIRVKLLRPGLRAQTRSGYFALPVVAGETLFPYEVGLLRAIETRPLPHALEFRSEILQFPASAGRVACVLVFEVPMEKLKTAVIDDKTVGMRIAVLALVRDQNGQVVKKLSGDLPFRVNRDRLGSLRKGNFVNVQNFDLPPGRYGVEAAVLDRQAFQAGAKRSVLFVPPSARPALSSIVLVRRVDRMEGAASPFEPLDFSGGRITPSVQGQVVRRPGSKAIVYFIARPLADSKTGSVLTIDVLANGKLLARTTSKLPEPNEHGLVPYLATIPVENLLPGEYEIHVMVREGAATAGQETRFDLTPPRVAVEDHLKTDHL